MITSVLVCGACVSIVSAQDIPNACGTRPCSEALLIADQFVLQLTYSEVKGNAHAYERGRCVEGGDSSGDFYAAYCKARLIQEPNQWRLSLPEESWILLDDSSQVRASCLQRLLD